MAKRNPINAKDIRLYTYEDGILKKVGTRYGIHKFYTLYKLENRVKEIHEQFEIRDRLHGKDKRGWMQLIGVEYTEKGSKIIKIW